MLLSREHHAGLEADVHLLPPLIPAFLLHRRHVHQPLQVRASAEEGSSSSATGSSNASTSQPSVSSPSPRTISLPRRFGTAAISIGAGGAAYFNGPGWCKAVSLWPFRGKPKTAVPEKDPKKVMIMYSNTGGGHRASAEALKSAFAEKHGDGYKMDIVDIWTDHTPPPFCRLPDSYSFLVKHAFLWRFSYELMQPRLLHLPYLSMVKMFCSRGISAAFDKYQPDLLVSVHPLMQHVPLWTLKQRIRGGTYRPINFATVVTDFTTCHNTWFSPGVTRCFVPTDFCKRIALRQGLKEPQIAMHGLPIRPIFSKPLAPKHSLKRQLGMEPSTPAVLLVGGGEGMGALEATVDELALRLGTGCQVVVVCGRNKKLLELLRAKGSPNGMRVIAVGFVDNIHEWMAASDAIITKAGPGTIAEALIAGLPILLNGNIPCQEEGNIPYVIENGAGAFEKVPGKIATIMEQWLAPGNEAFAEMARAAKSLGRPEAVYKIVADLAELADEAVTEWGPAAAAVGRRVHTSVKAPGLSATVVTA